MDQALTLQKSLISYIESLAHVADRFKDVSCVSVDGDEREGSMSLVFCATDKVTDDQVALKFIDPGIVAAGDIAALSWFDREYQIMGLVANNTRSAALTGEKDVLPLPIAPPGGGGEITLSIGFFPLEWLAGDVNRFFFDQANVPAVEKLAMLRDVFLAVRSIHQLQIAHRDIKRDNIRVSTSESAGSRLKLIDFGMAIEIDSVQSMPLYPSAIGANAFSPPECFLGLEGLREIAKQRDMYSLGALIYSVFNAAEFGVERSRATDFDTIVGAQRPSFLAAESNVEREELWCALTERSKYRLAPPDILGPYTSVPSSVSSLIERVYTNLCKFDYRARPDSLDRSIRTLESAAKVIENHKSEEVFRRRKRLLRERKLAKQKAKLERLEQQTGEFKCLT